MAGLGLGCEAAGQPAAASRHHPGDHARPQHRRAGTGRAVAPAACGVRATPDLTLREALAAFRQANGLPADETASAFWTCRLGPLTLRLPNFAWRRQAILAHDVHDVLTGYPCTLGGECQMAAWEFAAGRMPQWGPALFCLPLVPLGFLWQPRRMLRALRSGRRSYSLHGSDAIDRLLATPWSKACLEVMGGKG